MSSALYAMRLMWHGGRGEMSCGRLHVDLLFAPPVLHELGVSEIEYTPEVRVMQVREVADRWRDMTADERSAVRAWCLSKSAAVLAVVDA